MSITRRSDVIRAAYGVGRSNRSSRAEPPTPNRSLIGTATPHLASTAWTPALQWLRRATNLARWRTSSRSSRVAGGAIHASGKRPIRSRSARSAASRRSFFTRRYSNPFTPNGCARCTLAPTACRVSTAQYHPYVASSTTSGLSPARESTSGESVSIIGDPDRLEQLALGAGPHDHRPPAVKVNAHVLLPGIRRLTGTSQADPPAPRP